MTITSAKVVAHSRRMDGSEVVTFQLSMPKWLDAEFCKHRMVSSNSSSDRAVPFQTMRNRPYFLPDDVRKPEPGMQGFAAISDGELAEFHYDLELLRGTALGVLCRWDGVVHKQHLNRYLLGFSMQDKVATMNADYLRYFLDLREAPGADPAMQELACKMRLAFEQSESVERVTHQWHLPYVTEDVPCDIGRKLSVARCARVSYLNHDMSQPDIDKDIALHDKLLESNHMTPFEHQLKPMTKTPLWNRGTTHMRSDKRMFSGNIHGWVQYRHWMDTHNRNHKDEHDVRTL